MNTLCSLHVVWYVVDDYAIGCLGSNKVAEQLLTERSQQNRQQCTRSTHQMQLRWMMHWPMQHAGKWPAQLQCRSPKITMQISPRCNCKNNFEHSRQFNSNTPFAHQNTLSTIWNYHQIPTNILICKNQVKNSWYNQAANMYFNNISER